jgi:YHS domain-containing protein
MAVDPVCGIHVDERAAQPAEQYTAEYGGERFTSVPKTVNRFLKRLRSSTHASQRNFPGSLDSRFLMADQGAEKVRESRFLARPHRASAAADGSE